MRRSVLEIAVLLAVFVGSRFCWHLLGLRFFDGHLGRIMPFADVDLLRYELWTSLWLMDGQPPGFNLFLGLVLQLGGGQTAFHACFLLCGAVLCVGIYLLCRTRGVPGPIAVVLALVFSMRPATLFYENYLYFTYPTAALVVLACLLLAWAFRGGGTRWFLFWSTLAALCLVRSAFQVGLMVVVFVLAVLSVPNKKQLLWTFLVPFLLALSPSVKNAWLYGSFSSSSWLGANLAGITLHRMSAQERERWAAEGRLSPVARLQRFSSIEQFREALGPVRLLGSDAHPLRVRDRKLGGDINYHHALFSHVAGLYAKDAWEIIRTRPGIYMHGVKDAFLRYTSPPSHWHPLDGLRNTLGGYESTVVRWSHMKLSDRSLPGVTFLALPLLFILFIVRGIRWLRRRDGPNLLALLPLLLVVYVTCVSCLVDYGENNRFRFMIDALIFVEVAGLLALMAKRRRL